MKTNRSFISQSTLAVVIVLSIIAFGCSKAIDKLTTFKINHSQSISIPKSTTGQLTNTALKLTDSDVRTNSSQEFSNKGTRADLVKDVRLERLVLTINTPETENFGLLKSIKISIVADGLPAIELASKTDIAENAGRVLELNTTDARLDEYLKKDSYRLITEVVARRLNTENVQMQADITFKVTADLI